MPIYTFDCNCGNATEELRKLGDFTPPVCKNCGNPMQRFFTPVTTIFKGSGWTLGTYEKVRRRSEEQGNKFFNKHPDKQKMVHDKVNEQRSLENG